MACQSVTRALRYAGCVGTSL